MADPKIFRRYEIERDAQGIPTKLCWLGDCVIPPLPTRAEVDAQKLAEWQQLYGKRKA